MPFGGGGNRELITVTKDRDKRYLNTIGKSRYGIEDGTDLMIMLSIGEEDPGTITLVETLSAFTYAEDGLSRAEQIMIVTGVVAPGSLPNAKRDGDRKRDTGNKLFRKGKDLEEEKEQQ